MTNETDHFRLNSGPLRSSIIIELHTHPATRTWTGRRADLQENIYGIIGMPRFITIMNMIRLDSLADNPYADIWMLKLEERLLAAREDMNALTASMKTVFSQIPQMMTVESCLSIQPARFPVFAASHLGFIGIYLLTDFDELMRSALLAQHMALISRTEFNDLRQRGGTLIRSILVLAQHYRRIPVTRQDIRDGNARALAAQELAGPVPDDIFTGTRRSAFAAPLRQPEEHEAEPLPLFTAPDPGAEDPVVAAEPEQEILPFPEADDDHDPDA